MQALKGGNIMVYVKFFIKLIVNSIITIFVIGVALIFYFYFFEYTKIEQRDRIYVEDTGESLYLKRICSGIHFSAIIISIRKGRIINKKLDYCYFGNETLFYKLEGNTFYILCRSKAEIPPNFVKHVRIVQDTYSNLEYYDLIDNYSQKGYQKFPLSQIEKIRDKRSRK